MNRGAWHQFGDRSQRLAEEQLAQGSGVGVVMSPRDLAYDNAVNYATRYHELGAEVLIDQQFYVPHFTNARLDSYPVSQYRTTVSELCNITDSDLAGLARALSAVHRRLGADALIAPAVPYEAGRPDLTDLNARLFATARRAGDDAGIPTYATVMLGRSVSSSEQTMFSALSHATSLESDGWYYSFEFDVERIPSSEAAVLRCCLGGLALSCTGRPVLHAYAGPMALLSLGFGATGTGVGHFQNLWRFDPGRWEPSHEGDQGGGGEAPARFFSSKLWGTIVYPDELTQLPRDLQDQVSTSSPFCSPVISTPRRSWPRWDANRHLVYVICSTIGLMAVERDPRRNAETAMEILEGAVSLHRAIAGMRLDLRDNTNVYQESWLGALRQLCTQHSSDFEYLELLMGS